MTELSGLEVMILAREIGSKLSGTYVAGVYSVGGNQVLRFRHPGGADEWLVVSPRHGVWVSQKVAERAVTTDFTSKLRGEVERARFVVAGQADIDRVFDLELGEGEFLRHLIVEMMPPGNIAVTERDGRIRLLMHEVKSERRRLVKGGSYAPPPQTRKSPAEVTAEDVEVMLGKEKTVGKAIGRNVALPRKYVQEVLARLGLDESTPSADLKGRESEAASKLRGLVEEARERPRLSVLGTPEGDEIFVVSSSVDTTSKEVSSLCDICDDLLLPLVMGEGGEQESPEDAKRREVEATVQKLRAQEQELKQMAKQFRDLAARVKTASSLEEALDLVETIPRDGRRQREAPTSREAAASAVFERAKAFEKKAMDAGAAAEKLSARLASHKQATKRQTKVLARRSKEWYERFRWFYTSEGKLAVGGRDAQSNAMLVRRHLEDSDTVYHADLFGSPFFVLKAGRGQTDEEILELAQATVSFSSAWKTGLGAADAYWVFKEQVSTSAPSGEYLPKGSFLIKGKKNFVEHNLVQVAAGLDGQGRVVCGPESAVAKVARCYVILTPHREKSSETAKKVVKELGRLSVSKLELSVDEALRVLPAGGGKILRSKAEAIGGDVRRQSVI